MQALSLEERNMMDTVFFQALCGGTELRRAVPTNHPIAPSLFSIRLAATALGDPHFMVYSELFMGCVTPSTQFQE